MVWRDLKDPNGHEIVSLTKDGRTTSIEKYAGNVEVNESKAPKPFSDLINDSAKSYRESLEKGRVKLLGEEKVNGILTFKLQMSVNEEIRSSDSKKESLVQIINIRKDNYLPVRIVTKRLVMGVGGDSKIADSRTTVFSKIKLLDKTSLGSNFFSLEIPPNAGRHLSETFTLAEAKNFRDFDLYYLGQSFAGYKFDGFIERVKSIKHLLKSLIS